MEEKILGIFAEIAGKDVSEISPESRLDEDLELKSLHRFTLLAMLDEQFGKSPDPVVAGEWNLVSEWIAFYQD